MHNDEDPFLGAGFPPHLRGPGDGWEPVPRRRTPGGGAIGEEAPVAPAGDQNQFQALAGSLHEVDEADDVASVKAADPPQQKKKAKSSSSALTEAAPADAAPPKKRKSQEPPRPLGNPAALL